MDDQAVIRTYGNTNLPEGTEDRPLVTFALFAYNQEKYIREAVEGAFSQTYSPLEIILSDDCSSDRTFEIIEEMAREYQGPHLVKVRRGERNVGVIDHVISVARLSLGELLVVAAGDDYSFANRVEKLTELWAKSSADALYSGSTDIDDTGNVILKENIPEPLDRVQKLFENCVTPIRYNGKIRNIPGYSAAYARGVFEGLPLTNRGIHNEDALTTYVINLKGGKIDFCRCALLARRISITSISAVSDQRTIEAIKRNEVVIEMFSRSTRDFIDYFCNLPFLNESADAQEVRRRLSAEKDYYATVAGFWNLTLAQRFRATFKGGKITKFALPRLFGKLPFFYLKLTFNRVRQGS